MKATKYGTHLISIVPVDVRFRQLSAEGSEQWVVAVGVAGDLYFRLGRLSNYFLETVNKLLEQNPDWNLNSVKCFWTHKFS